MRIGQVQINNFRNFYDATINFAEKTLIIGSNDVGKSNLLHAIRLILDKSFSEIDLEPRDSDFYAFEETNEFSITIKFEEIQEDCVIAKLKENISDDGVLFLRYHATRDKKSNAKTFKLFAGHDLAALQEIESRYYLKVLNLKYISSNRDLYSYMKKERKY